MQNVNSQQDFLEFCYTDKQEKESGIAALRKRGSKEKITREVKKCKVLCSNCHRDLHYQEKISKGS